jgi:hypothetical protein
LSNEIGRDVLTEEYWAWKYRSETNGGKSYFLVPNVGRVEAVAHLRISNYFHGDTGRNFKVAILEDVIVTESQYIRPILQKAIFEAKREGAVLVKADVDPRNRQLFSGLMDAGFSQFREVIGMYRSENSNLDFSDFSETPWYVPIESVEGEP